MTSSLASQIYQRTYLTGEFTLRSGQVSDHYFDKYQFESDPLLLNDICQQLPPRLAEAELLAGLEMGGIPIATMMSQLTSKPLLMVRKEAKAYGTAKLAEGCEFSGKRLLIVEDVVSSGGQINLSANELRDRRAVITDAVCVIDREMGGSENLASNGIKLTALFTETDLVSA